MIIAPMGAVSILPMGVTFVVAVAAILLARLGYRWRRVAIPPACARCGYDVSARPTGVERCSECGADLAGPRAIQTTRRVVHRWIALPATLVAIVAITAFAFLGVRFEYGTWFRAHAPIAWIHSLARRDRGPGGDKFRAAWKSRDNSPAYIDHLLDIQGDDAIAWRGGLGDDLFLALDGKAMSAAQRDRFARQLFTTRTFRVRTPVRVGDPLPIAVDFTPKGGAKQQVMSRRMLAAKLDGATIPNELFSFGGGLGHDDGTLPADMWGNVGVAPGRHRVNLLYRRQLCERRPGTHGSEVDPLFAPVDATATFDIDVLPAGTPLGTAVPAPERAAEVAASIDVVAGKVSAHQWKIMFRLDPADVDRAFVVYARIGGVEKRIGDVALAAGRRYWTSGQTFAESDMDLKIPESVTITFVGDGDALARTLDQQTYWPGRIVFEDVPLVTGDQLMDAMNHRVPSTTRPYRFEPTTRP